MRLKRPPARALRPVIPNNARTLCITAAAGTELAGASSPGTVTPKGISSLGRSSPVTAVYTPKGFLPHAASLRQTFVHCARFPTAASRRSLGRISVPMWPVVLSDRLRVVGLVSRYLTNYLIRRGPLKVRSLSGAFLSPPCRKKSVCGISTGFPVLPPTPRQVAHVLRTRSPLPLPRRRETVRLACVKRAASVRPEPGSNSPLDESISSLEQTASFVRFSSR